MLVARISVPPVLVSQMPMSTPWMVVWRKVAVGLRMNDVIYGIERARRDANALISGVVGSSHETTPFNRGVSRSGRNAE